jgi:small subunit ribosomal protein S18
MAMMKRKRKRKGCSFCQNKHSVIDYKDIKKLERYLTDRGKVLPRRVTGNCAKHQRTLTIAIKRARIIALLPFVSE